jgi:hypothetical protein
MTTIVNVNTLELFNANELKQSVKQLVNQVVHAWDMFITMSTILGNLFKTLTNFNLSKFDELVTLMVPTIQAHVKSIKEGHIVTW